MSGISVVICCHNSAERLPSALRHLAASQDPGTPWEVIVVDNASTDATAAVAKNAWPTNLQIPLRVLVEPKPGLSHARVCALSAANYDIVAFVDDDNWVQTDWLRIGFQCFQEDVRRGAVGGLIEPAIEQPPPWFARHAAAWVVGPQADTSGDVTWSRGFLWGAGLWVRRQAWQELQQSGFQFLLSGRLGKRLSSGEDSELCRALRNAGWTLWYDERLRIKHAIPVIRITWAYLTRLAAAIGASTVVLDLYDAATDKACSGSWRQEMRHALALTIRLFVQMLRRGPYRIVDNQRWLDICLYWHRARELLRWRHRYDIAFARCAGEGAQPATAVAALRTVK